MSGLVPCPFGNIICGLCGQSFDYNINTSPATIGSSLARHVGQNCPHRSTKLNLNSNRVYHAILDATESVGRYHALLEIRSQEDTKKFLNRFLDLSKAVSRYYCITCLRNWRECPRRHSRYCSAGAPQQGKIYLPKKSILEKYNAGFCYLGGAGEPVFVLGRWYQAVFNRVKAQVLEELQRNPDDAATLEARYRAEAVSYDAENRAKVLGDHDPSFRHRRADRQFVMPDPADVVDLSGTLFDKYLQDELTAQCVNSAFLASTLSNPEEMQRAVSELNMLAIQGSGAIHLLSFIRKCGVLEVVVNLFGGSWKSFSNWAAAFVLAPPTGDVQEQYSAEEHVEYLGRELFNESYGILQRADPFFRAEVSRVGDIDQRGSVSRLQQLVEDLRQATSGSGDSDDPGGSVSDLDVSELLANLEAFASGHAPQTITGKILDDISDGTIDTYRRTLGKFVLFLYRCKAKMKSQNNQAWPGELAIQKSLESGSPHYKLEAKALLFGLVMMSINTTTHRPLFTPWGLPELFVFGSAVDRSFVEDPGQPIIRFHSPATIRKTSAALQYGLRCSFLRAYLGNTAHQDLPLEWKRRYHSASVLVQSPTMKNLAHISAVANNYQRKAGTVGSHAAAATRSSASCPYKDRFSIDCYSGRVTISHATLAKGIASGILEGKKTFGDMLRALVDGYKAAEVEAMEEEEGDPSTAPVPSLVVKTVPFELDLCKAGDLEAVIACVVNTLPQAVGPNQPGGFIAFSRKLLKRNILNEMVESEDEIYAATISATYTVTVPRDDSIAEVSMPSSQLALVLAEALEKHHCLLESFDRHSNRLLRLLIGLNFLVYRGEPRMQEYFRLTCGVTNCFQTTCSACDFVVCSYGEHASRILLHSVVNKYNPQTSGKDRTTPFLLAPDSFSNMVFFMLSIVRTVQVQVLAKIGESISNSQWNVGHKMPLTSPHRHDTREVACCIAAARLVVDISLSPRQNGSKVLSVQLREDFKKETEEVIQHLLGVPVRLESLRQLLCTLVVEAHKHLQDVKPRARFDSLARGFNHSVHTHFSSYMVQHQDQQHAVVTTFELEMEREEDELYHQFLGIAGLDSRKDKTYCINGQAHDPFALQSFQRFRVFGNSETVGLLRLFCGSHISLNPLQPPMFSEVLSLLRDCLFVYPCGSGKTTSIWVPHAYALFCETMALPEQECIRNLCDELGLETGEALEALGDPAIQALTSFAASDNQGRIPRGAVTFAIVPTRILAEDIVKSISEVRGIKAIRWHQGTEGTIRVALENLIQARRNRVCTYKRIAAYDVIVMTVAQADTEPTRRLMEQAVEAGIVLQIAIDEAHTVLFDLAWMQQLIRIRQLRRQNVRFLLLTGTLHTDLVPELAACLHSSIGTPTVEAIQGSSLERSIFKCPTNDFLGLHKEWTGQFGIHRSKPTIPSNLRFAVLEVEKLDSDFYLHVGYFASKLLSLEPPLAKKIHILVAQRHEVRYLKLVLEEVAPQIQVCSLVGGSSEEDFQSFQSLWREEATQIAVTTTVGAQGINNQDCDCVIWTPAYYGTQLLVQGAARAGRKKQKSNVIVFHSPKEYEKELKSDQPRLSFMPYQDAGVNTVKPKVAACLSIDSMKQFFKPPDDLPCRRANLERSVDGLASDSSAPSEEERWCCDLCNLAWGNRLRGQLGASKVASSRLGVEAKTALFQRMTEAHASPIQPDPPTTAARALGSQNTASLDEDVALLAARQRAGTVSTFFNQSPTRDGHQCCHWHSSIARHQVIDQGELFSFDKRTKTKTPCFEDALTWCGYSSQEASSRDLYFCFKCFDRYRRKQWHSCTFERRHTSDGFCGRCGWVGRHSCQRDSNWGLVLWAFRSKNGYEMVKANFKSKFTSSPFPERVPFFLHGSHNEQELRQRIQLGKQALDWLQLPNNNHQFWDCVYDVLQQLGQG